MNPDLLRRKKDVTHGISEIAGPSSAPLNWLTLSHLHLLHDKPEYVFSTGDNETVLDIFSGLCTVNIRTPDTTASYPEVGGRLNVFAGKPTMIYIPRESSVSIFAESSVFDGVLMSAPAHIQHKPQLVYPDDAEVRIVGKDNWQRTVVTSIGENVNADRLIVGETTNPPGNWSSAPPHKHDSHENGEVPMEEVYVFKLNPAQGFGIQRVYTPSDAEQPFDVSYAVRDGDAVVLPRGYHPVVAAPGYQLFYLWALAGEGRKYGAWSDDPEHSWIKGVQ
jgi:5-deoxy-glucuronate isomerase